MAKKLVINQSKVNNQTAEAVMKVCPFGGLEYTDGKLNFTAGCKNCGLCVRKGPEGVVTFVEEADTTPKIDKSKWVGVSVFMEIDIDGIKYATELDMYVVIDWHMLGAEDHGDENPLYYLEESMEFFDKITTLYKDNENLLFEIMNEPSGETTWQDCKDYANQVIPVIRKNNDGIVLVGNPQWSADLISVMKDPLEGYENIMYTYHFYAADHYDTTEVITAFAAGLPIFITEHGGMESSGDGDINLIILKIGIKF